MGIGVSIYSHIHIHIYIHLYIYIYIYNICTCIYVYMCVCVYLCKLASCLYFCFEECLLGFSGVLRIHALCWNSGTCTCELPTVNVDDVRALPVEVL